MPHDRWTPGSRSLVWAGLVLTVGALGLASLPAAAQTTGQTVVQTNSVCATPSSSNIQLSVANPIPGSSISSGNLIISGTAFDKTSKSGTGITTVSVFLDPRNTGGDSLGTATLGLTNAQQGGQFGASGWDITVSIPTETDTSHMISVYADSSSGQEASVQVPVVINKAPPISGQNTPTPLPTTCTVVLTGGAAASGAAPVSVPSVASPSASPAAQTVVQSGRPISTTSCSTPDSSPLHLDVSNPVPGTGIPSGMLIISGVAFDRDATGRGNVGISSVSVFLDPRDTGGSSFGTATLGLSNPAGGRFGTGGWSQTVNINTSTAGTHNLTVYAVSSVTGKEAWVSIPVVINPTPGPTGGQATPTPLPNTCLVFSP